MRHSEKVDLRKAGYAQSLAIASGPVVPVVAAIFTFLGVVLSGNDLLASDNKEARNYPKLYVQPVQVDLRYRR
ncbi:unnamed protein product [Anisakis simplex]|uniref:ATP-binding cassette sub-family C member 11 (inferred by orthology to a human protein) n=1 Tax=Anisakis simplex TaxID=6269 RepID=A0A0M3JA93_ANISI|nr:unnamed protein product [Anisakis simplex]